MGGEAALECGSLLPLFSSDADIYWPKGTIGSEIIEARAGKRKQACALQSASRPVFPHGCDLNPRQDLLIPRRWSAD
jgi:hypothetical protein